MRNLIILAAGQAIQLDGYNKLLINDPVSNKNILENYLDVFQGFNAKVVLGYRAINVIHKYPNESYVFNKDWAITNSSYSLGLAIENINETHYIVSGDLIFDKELLLGLEDDRPNLVATRQNENRHEQSLNVVTDEFSQVKEIYKGRFKDVSHPEAVGIIKVSCPQILRTLKQNCLKNKNLFVGENLPLTAKSKFYSFGIDEFRFHEINTVNDYLNLIG